MSRYRIHTTIDDHFVEIIRKHLPKYKKLNALIEKSLQLLELYELGKLDLSDNDQKLLELMKKRI